MSDFDVRFLDGIGDVDEGEWERLVEGASPFLAHGFLAALEETGCVGPGTGWTPQPLTLWEGDGEDEELVGALPLYIKTDSAGEFVFDWSWADAALRSGIDYYPKAVVQVPFTPVMGKRLLVAPDRDDVPVLRRRLIDEAVEFVERESLSSVHFNFVRPDELDALKDADLPVRESFQYHWYNGRELGDAKSFESFEDFLSELRSKKRSNIKRERRRFRDNGGRTEVLAGSEVTDAHLERMFRYYRRTCRKYFGGSQYLNEEFFLELGERMRDRLHLVIAEQDGEEFGAAFNVFEGDRLYGRYWGAVRDVKFSHFEAGFYSSIEWCIDEEMELFEGGSGGDHKYDRGFMPTYTYSGHYIRHPSLKQAIRDFVRRERDVIESRAEELREHLPFKEHE
jgi:predicted N-acyltransferase